MDRSIVIIGAGPGLGHAVARRYAGEGYRVVLVARRQDALEQLASELRQANHTVDSIAADLAEPGAPDRLVDQIRALVGTPDTIYYGPSIRGYVPVSELVSDRLRELMPLALYALVDTVHAFLPDMLERKQGAILATGAPSAISGIPQLSATAGLAAQRNYLQSLQATVSAQGVYIGRLYIAAMIERSAFHQAQEAARAAGQPTINLPSVDPDHLADLLWAMHQEREVHERVYPDATHS